MLTASKARRRSGSHYTPPPLARAVVQHALAARRGQRGLREGAELTVHDPSMGAGALLVAAAQAIAEETGRDIGRIITSGLSGVDIDAEAVEVARLVLWLLARPEQPPGAFLLDRLSAGDALLASIVPQSQDLVVGNPPYIPFYGRGSQRASYPDSYRQMLRDRHGSIDGVDAIGGRLNTFLVFCVQATTLLRPGGIAAMVLPDSILTNASYEPMRRVLSVSGRLRVAVRYADPVFSGASVGTAVAVWGGRRTSGNVRLFDGARCVSTEPVRTLCERPRTTWYPLSSRDIRRRTLSGDGVVALSRIARVKDGLNTGARRTRERLLCSAPDGDPTLRLCLEGKNIHPFSLTTGALWVRYNPALLRPDRGGASLGERAFFDAPKILYRQTAAFPIAAVDAVGHCYRNSAHGVCLLSHDDDTLWALCAWLNAAVLCTHYQTVTGETRRTFPQIHVSSMKEMPVPAAFIDGTSRAVRELADIARAAAGSGTVPAILNEAAAALVGR